MGHLKGRYNGIRRLHISLVHEIVTSSDPMVAFKDADYALLVGSRPRKFKGMERKDLLEVNGTIFIGQGKALAAVVAKKM